MDDGVARISGHIEDLQQGLTLFCLVCKFAAVHAGHDYIGQKQMDGFVPLQQAQRMVAVGGFEDVVSERVQRFDDVAAHVGVVLDDQHAFAGAAAARFAGGLFRCGRASKKPR